METARPYDSDAHPHQYRKGRACFEEPIDGSPLAWASSIFYQRSWDQLCDSRQMMIVMLGDKPGEIQHAHLRIETQV